MKGEVACPKGPATEAQKTAFEPARSANALNNLDEELVLWRWPGVPCFRALETTTSGTTINVSPRRALESRIFFQSVPGKKMTTALPGVPETV